MKSRLQAHPKIEVGFDHFMSKMDGQRRVTDEMIVPMIYMSTTNVMIIPTDRPQPYRYLLFKEIKPEAKRDYVRWTNEKHAWADWFSSPSCFSPIRPKFYVV